MFRKVLIANRGEIACRVIATCRRIGIVSVAVYSDADANSLHVELADESYPIGAAPARESYLVGRRIIDVALRTGAEAIHPGYGFLSENAEFAESCAQAGIVFVGPPASAIRSMGSKAAAKSLMERSGVPLVPGYHGEDQSPEVLRREAASIGYPVLIKASAGGGGKGMRVVQSDETFDAELAGAQREAAASFGDDRMLIEKYLTRPRHIEIQVFADTHGNVVSLFERDCSIQRRHQKVLEEAPAPGMDPVRRRAMGDAACAAARAVDYVGAGTVEFIAEGDAFYFMEMNTRLQVEHPVTEMITGEELVEWQFRVASGEPLPRTQQQIGIAGHAIEARIYAEDPARDFLPSIGTLAHLRQPTPSTVIRIDTGVRSGDSITPNYDPMIAKLIVHGADRTTAVRRLQAALAQYEVVGVATNLGLLRAIADHPDFVRGAFDTGFIGRHPDVLTSTPSLNEADRNAIWAAAAITEIGGDVRAEPGDPWDLADAWRMNGDGYQDLTLRLGELAAGVRIFPHGDGRYRLVLPSGDVVVSCVREPDGSINLRVDGAMRRLRVLRHAGRLVVVMAGINYEVVAINPLAPPAIVAAVEGKLTAPIPARVARVMAKAGDDVAKGTVLIVLEAMKMEITLSAPIDGRIEAIRCAEGDMVDEGAALVTFATGDTA